MKSVATRFVPLFVVMTCLSLIGCSGSSDAPPPDEIPNIPPATRTMPATEGDDQGNTITPTRPPG